MGIKKVNKKYDLGVGFDEKFKTDNHIVFRANEMFGWIVRNFISRETNVAIKVYKTLQRPYIEYHTQAWVPMLMFIHLFLLSFNGI